MFRRRQKVVFQMIAQVVNFGITHPEFFPKGSLAAQVLERLQAYLAAMSDHASSEYTGATAIRTSSGSLSAARKTLRVQLEAVHQTARGMNLNGLWVPRSRSDRAFITAASAFANEALPLKDELIGHGLPPDFIEQLKSAVQNMEKAIVSYKGSKESRASAAAAFDDNFSEALNDLRRFDSIVKNLLRGDPVNQAAWKLARHVERKRGAGTPAAKTVDPSAGKEAAA